MDDWLESLRIERDRMLSDILGILEGDNRVQSAWLSGSFGRGAEDALSDIDLHVAVTDDAFDAWVAKRAAFYDQIGKPLLVRPDKPSDAGSGVYQAVVFPGPRTLDLNVHPASTAIPQIDHRLLISRIPLCPETPEVLDEKTRHRLVEEAASHFWAMAPIALKYLARGQIDRAVIQVYLLQSAYVTLWRLVNDPERRNAGGPFWLHPTHDQALLETLPVLGQVIDSREVLGVISLLLDGMTELQEQCVSPGIASLHGVIAEITNFRDEVAELAVITLPSHEEEGQTHRIHVNSSMISSVGYHSETETLEIEFNNGHIYQYFEVPHGKYRAFLAADSKGRFFLDNIENTYPNQQIR